MTRVTILESWGQGLSWFSIGIVWVRGLQTDGWLASRNRCGLELGVGDGCAASSLVRCRLFCSKVPPSGIGEIDAWFRSKHFGANPQFFSVLHLLPPGDEAEGGQHHTLDVGVKTVENPDYRKRCNNRHVVVLRRGPSPPLCQVSKLSRRLNKHQELQDLQQQHAELLWIRDQEVARLQTQACIPLPKSFRFFLDKSYFKF